MPAILCRHGAAADPAFVLRYGRLCAVDTASRIPRRHQLQVRPLQLRRGQSLLAGSRIRRAGGRFGTPEFVHSSRPRRQHRIQPAGVAERQPPQFPRVSVTRIPADGILSNLQKRGSISYLAPRFQNAEGRSLTFALLYDKSLDVRTFASRREEGSVQVVATTDPRRPRFSAVSLTAASASAT